MRIRLTVAGKTQGISSFWTGTIVILVVSLFIGLFAADELIDTLQRYQRLDCALAQASQEVAEHQQLSEKAATERDRLARLQTRTVPADRVREFRQEIAELARESGCQLRNLQVGEPSLRAWEAGWPLFQVKSSKEIESAQQAAILSTQSLQLSVSGPLSATKHLMDRLGEANQLIHTASLTLTANPKDAKEVTLDAELILFDVKDPSPLPTTKGAGSARGGLALR